MDDYTELTGTIIGAAMEVHNYWGPGLIESIYEKSLQHELTLRNVEVRRQVKLQLKYKDLELDDDYALDLIVDGRVIVELKVVKELACKTSSPLFAAATRLRQPSAKKN